MNPGPAISIFSKISFSVIAATISSAIFLGGFLRTLAKDIAAGVARSPNASSFGNSITISGMEMPNCLTAPSIMSCSFFFIEIKFTPLRQKTSILS